MAVTLLGTIPGFVPDAERVRQAIEAHRPDCIALGIPPEDMESLHALMDDPKALDDIPEVDGVEALFLSSLMEFGDIQVIPSPDLEAAMQSGIPVHPIDMDDATHTDLYTESVKVRHLVQKGRVAKRLEKKPPTKDNPYQLAVAWDQAQCKVRPLAALEAAREAHMAAELRAMDGNVLAIVHVARLAGIEALL
ncbi:MAG: hypothetical protein ACPHK8_00865 [Thermoplasmatota archaeon]